MRFEKRYVGAVFAALVAASVLADVKVDQELAKFYEASTNLWQNCRRDEVRKLADERLKKCPDDLTAWLVRASWSFAYGDEKSYSGLRGSDPLV